MAHHLKALKLNTLAVVNSGLSHCYFYLLLYAVNTLKVRQQQSPSPALSDYYTVS
jgi:hypothetical protein